MAILKNTTVQDSEGIKIPRGNTAQRPGTPETGMIRYNTDYNLTEFYTGSSWRPMDESVVAWSTGADIGRVGDEVAHIWRDPGNHQFFVDYGGTIKTLVVGGGGSGGGSSTNCSAGGGGAGGFVETTVTQANGSTTVISVGKGGTGGNPGSDGGGDNSFVGRDGSTSAYGAIQGIGGGGGGGGQGRTNGRAGGSSGGGAHPNGVGGAAQQPSQAFGGFGRVGGTASSVSPEWGGGGGGGAGEPGQPGNPNYGGKGGDGRMSGITGISTWYAGGGGGGGCTQSGTGTRGIVQFTGQGGASGTNAGEGGLGGGGSANQQWSNDVVIQRFQNGKAAENTGSGGSAGSYNGGGTRSGDGGSGNVAARYRSRIVKIGNSASNPAQSAAQIKSYNPYAQNGLYWVLPNGWSGASQQIYCDMEYDGGGWMLVASNHSSSSVIPSGTSRHNAIYELDRTGVLGSPDPNTDYIIGSMINDLPYSQARVWGFGFDSTSAGFVWPNNLGGNVKAFWGLTTAGPARLTQVRDRFDGLVRVVGNGFGGSLSANAQYFSLDGIKQDRVNGGFSANPNQTTIGGVGVQGSSGDPTTGAYLGHGTTEESGSYEGWYDSHNNVRNCSGYTTWVR